MAANIKDESERLRRINLVGEYFVNTGASTREIAKYFSSYYFEISNKTVSLYIKEYMKMNPEKEEEIKKKIDINTEKTIDDSYVVERVLKVARLILDGKTIEEASKELDISYKTAERDISVRLKELGKNDSDLKKYYDAVVKVLHVHQVDALNENRNSHLKR